VRHTLRAGADTEMPAEALTRVDRAINDETGGAMFCTLAHARIETRDSGPALVTAAIAGHPEPLIVRRSGRVERVATTGPLLGAFGDASFGEVSFELAPGETLVLVTDGVIEARARGQLFGEQRLEALLGAAAGLPLEAMLAGLEEAVVRFAGGQPQDDLALLAVRLSTAAKGGVAADPAIRGAGRWREPGP
jgi:serine phosphatase RsbU (regulator of sigma subunit)